MSIFANEFFTCPSYAYGILVVSIIGYFVAQILSVAIGDIAMFLPLILTVGWALYALFRFVMRDPRCARVGFPEGQFRNPFASAPRAPKVTPVAPPTQSPDMTA